MIATPSTMPSHRCVTFAGRFSLAEELAEAASSIQERQVQLDFSNVDAIGSVELTALIRFVLRMREGDTNVVVENASEIVGDVFRITKFDRLAHVD